MSATDKLRFELNKTTEADNSAEQVQICRDVLDGAIDIAFEETGNEISSTASMLEKIDSRTISELVQDEDVVNALHYVRVLGNNAKHGKKTKKKEAELAVKNTELFLDIVDAKASGALFTYEKPKYMTEEMTRKLYIDTYLKESGWDVLDQKDVPVAGKASIEIKVDGMPNGQGVGYCDYVLYGRDGKPLAIVEAKKTSVDPVKGRHQVDLYGECMKAVYGYKPVLYYTNGYKIKVIDGLYPDRTVSAFHTADELELMLQRRNRGDITDLTIRDDITNRPYQKIAITNLCEHFNKNKRRGLLVMATGTGKTRVAISLVDVLARNNWVKNVLFLADRTALVSQAKRAFATLLPEMSVCELSGSGEKDYNARLMFCTYQTMINYIDAEDKRFSSGRFDLVIIDEAHRSIFNKYSSIFSYFDCLLVGLTATPKDEVDANTYSVFGCDSGVPNFDYSLEDAVQDGYLVPYIVINKTTKLFDRGTKYAELSQEEKDQLEEYLEEINDPDPDVVLTSRELFKKLYNKDTCRKILEDVMNYGIKVNDGETLGKTIIFAYNHKHAEMIVECFHEMYPKHPANYCQLIDNYVNYADNLVLKFGSDDEFRLAISVDMLDTGVDIPEAVNLVFFKPVKSKIKFLQMIGRGTRLCPDLFGKGKDKTHFLIFDYCGNFEYFDEHPEGTTPKPTYSISQKLFDVRLEMLHSLQALKYQQDPYTKAYYDDLKTKLNNTVKDLKGHSEKVQIREQMAYVDKYYDIGSWAVLSPVMVKEMQLHITPLLDSGTTDHFKVVRFDARMAVVQNAILSAGDTKSVAPSVKAVKRYAKQLLEEYASIPQVQDKADRLKELVGDAFWTDVSFESLEEMRKEVRDLMQFIDSDSNAWITDVEDRSEDAKVSGDAFGWFDIRTYREKVIDYLFEHSESPTIKKIQQLEPINDDDLQELERILWKELGSREEYDRISDTENVAVFIRSLVGLDQTVINKKFNEYLSSNLLNSMQQEFIRTIINYVRENGDITKEDLLETSPFDSYDIGDLFGDKLPVVVSVVDAFHNCVRVAS